MTVARKPRLSRAQSPALRSDESQDAWETSTALVKAVRGDTQAVYTATPPQDVCRCCGHHRYWIRPDGSEYVCAWCVPQPAALPVEFYEVPPKEYPCRTAWRLASETELLASSESPAGA